MPEKPPPRQPALTENQWSQLREYILSKPPGQPTQHHARDAYGFALQLAIQLNPRASRPLAPELAREALRWDRPRQPSPETAQ